VELPPKSGAISRTPRHADGTTVAHAVAMPLRSTFFAVATALICGGCASILGYDDVGFDRARGDRAASAVAPAVKTTFAEDVPGPVQPVAPVAPGDAAPPPVPPPPSAALADGITISEIALFQGVRVTLAQGGAKSATRAMPVVAGRDGRMRVYVTPSTGFAPKALTAELHLFLDGKELSTATDTKSIATSSADNLPGSTFEFDVPGASLSPAVQYSVRIADPAAPPAPPPASSPARYPADGATEAVDAKRGADRLKIVLVPVRYGADGSNRLPDTSASILDMIRSRTLELYPVPAVDLTIHSAIDHTGVLAADGTGWNDLLAAITQLRLTEQPAADVYYYGVFAPASDFLTYCGAGCVAGLSNLGESVADATTRASLGVLYNRDEAFETVPHEIGHAHGRSHAPCGGPANPDPAYPYPNATIPSWGYSIVTKQFVDPTAASAPHDFMGYCTPAWTSDYTFRALFDRGVALATTRVTRSVVPAPRVVRWLMEDADGSLRWHGSAPLSTSESFGGVPTGVRYLGAGNVILGTAVAHRYRYDHVAGSSFVVPDVPRATVRVAIDGVGAVRAP
jgi:hypothetical protein